MPGRSLVAKEFSGFLSALAHPQRLRIVAELRTRELDVNALQQLLGISHSGVSQSLAVLRAHRLVQERRDGRRVFYSLCRSDLAEWLLEGLRFLETEAEHGNEVRFAVREARHLWGSDDGTVGTD